MRKLTRSPWLGTTVEWFTASRAWRLYRHLDERKWTRLAAAITFSSFVTFFPALGVGAAVCAALLSERRLEEVERWASRQVPGISERLDLHAFFEHAGTIGLVSALLVVPTGAAWVDSLRGCLRALWDLPDPEQNFVLRRLADVGVLAGLGAVTLLSLGASALGQGALRWAGRRLEAGPVLGVLAYALAMVVTFFLLAYLLVWLPGVRPPREAALAACAMGAVGFEVLKLLLGSYLTEVAGRSVYGAFGVPIALLVWMNLMAKLLLVCCAWTATAVSAAERPCADALDEAEADAGDETDTPPRPAG